MEPTITIHQAAFYFNVSTATIANWRRDYGFPKPVKNCFGRKPGEPYRVYLLRQVKDWEYKAQMKRRGKSYTPTNRVGK